MLNPSVMEKQKINPPRMLRTDPAQPMKSAAPSSNLREDTRRLVIIWVGMHTSNCRNVTKFTSVSQIRGQRTLMLSGVRRESRRSWSRFLQRGQVCHYRTLSITEKLKHKAMVRQHLPLRIKCSPHRQVILALVVSGPPILVHFMPTSARIAPKNPKHTAEIISPRHNWI